MNDDDDEREQQQRRNEGMEGMKEGMSRTMAESDFGQAGYEKH